MQDFAGIGAQNRFRVRQLVMVELGNFDMQFRRPYETVINPEIEQIVQERFDQNQPAVAGNVAGFANQFIVPSATYEKPVQIANGWGSRRLAYCLLIDHQSMTGMELTQVITGYSEHFDPSLQGSMDIDLNFFINSTTTLRNTIARTAIGNRSYYNVAEASHVIAENTFENLHQPEKEYRMRPADVFSTMTRLHMHQQNQDVVDTRSLITNKPMKSRRGNANTTSYAASLFESYRTAQMLDKFGQTDDQILSQARANTSEQASAQDPFLSALTQMRGMQSNFFTLRDLLRLDSHALDDEVAALNVTGQVQSVTPFGVNFFNNTNNQANWEGTTRYTQVATILGHSVPAIMVENAVAKIIVHCSNRNEFQQPEVLISQWLDFPAMAGTSIDMTEFIEKFKWRLVNEVLNDISVNNEIDYEFNLKLDLLGESILEISMAGMAPETYSLPSFCDALLVPVITNNDQRSMQVASDFKGLFSAAYNPNENFSNITL